MHSIYNPKLKLRLIKIAHFQETFPVLPILGFQQIHPWTISLKIIILSTHQNHFRYSKYVGNCANMPWRCNKTDSTAKSRIAEKMARFINITKSKRWMVWQLILNLFEQIKCKHKLKFKIIVFAMRIKQQTATFSHLIQQSLWIH